MNDDDLVKRLRDYRIGCGIHCSHYENREPLDECIEAANRIEQLTSGPGGIMEMKQTIADKEQEIERLHVALREIALLNNQRDRFSSQIDFIICQILNGKKDD